MSINRETLPMSGLAVLLFLVGGGMAARGAEPAKLSIDEIINNLREARFGDIPDSVFQVPLPAEVIVEDHRKNK